jgi:lipid A 3-O-deacylase PagL
VHKRSSAEARIVAGRHRTKVAIVVAMIMSASIAPSTLFAQSWPDGWFARAAFTPAYVIPTNPELSNAPAGRQVHWTPSQSIEIGRQTDGSQEWHHLYGLPSYGFGISLASLNGRERSSRPIDAYTFFSWPFARPSERVRITTDFGMGLSWNWKEFNPQTNSDRNVLTSAVNVRIDWGFYLRYSLTPQTSLYAGIDYTHRSNGGMRQPDLGINVIGPSVALRYDLAEPPRLRPRKPLARFQPSWEFLGGGVAGLKNIGDGRNPGPGQNFAVGAANAGLQRQFYRYGKIAAGTDFTIDGATGALHHGPREPGAADHLSLGVYGGYEHLIGRFGALVHLGYKVANGYNTPDSSQWYGRYGWRFHFSDRLWGIFAVRATEGKKADFLEFGLGYRKTWP